MSDTAHPLVDMMLARLLIPGKKPPALGVIHKDLAPLFQGGLTKDRVAAVMTELRASGFLPAKGQLITDAGRVRGLAYLGIAQMPPKCNWATIRAKFLIPKALGLTPWSEAEVARLSSTDKLAARLLKQKYDLPVSADTNLTGVLESLVCRLIGYPTLTTLKELAAVAISREVGAEPALPVKELNKVAPRLLLGSTKSGIEGFRALVVNGTLRDKVEPEPKPELEAFAERVTASARTCPTGWFGDKKVFISHVWRHIQHEAEFRSLDLAAFKAMLLKANRARFLTLSRADLVQLMDADDVRESEISYLSAEFHFILIQKEN